MEFRSIEDYEKIFSDIKTELIPDENAIIITASGLKSEIRAIELGSNKIFSVKYHRSNNAPHVSIPIEFPNGNKYAAYLDSTRSVIKSVA